MFFKLMPLSATLLIVVCFTLQNYFILNFNFVFAAKHEKHTFNKILKLNEIKLKTVHFCQKSSKVSVLLNDVSSSSVSFNSILIIKSVMILLFLFTHWTVTSIEHFFPYPVCDYFVILIWSWFVVSYPLLSEIEPELNVPPILKLW